MNVGEELARLAKLRDDGILSSAEFEQQKAALLARGGSAAPTAAPTAKKSSSVAKGCGIVAGVVVVLAVIGALVGGGSSTSGGTQQASAPAAPPLAVTAAQLFDAYQANEAAAQQTYGGQPLLVTGTVDGVDLDFADKPYVKLRTSNQFMSAQAKLTESSQPRASSLKKGAQIKLLCGGVGEVMGMPMLKDCDIQ